MKDKLFTIKKTQFGWGVWSKESEKFVHTWTGAEAKKSAIRRAKQLNEGA